MNLRCINANTTVAIHTASMTGDSTPADLYSPESNQSSFSHFSTRSSSNVSSPDSICRMVAAVAVTAASQQRRLSSRSVHRFDASTAALPAQLSPLGSVSNAEMVVYEGKVVPVEAACLAGALQPQIASSAHSPLPHATHPPHAGDSGHDDSIMLVFSVCDRWSQGKTHGDRTDNNEDI